MQDLELWRQGDKVSKEVKDVVEWSGKGNRCQEQRLRRWFAHDEGIWLDLKCKLESIEHRHAYIHTHIF